jgi:hypothetical protein
MIVAREEGLVNVNSVGHSFAQAMASENHLEFDVDSVMREVEVKLLRSSSESGLPGSFKRTKGCE